MNSLNKKSFNLSLIAVVSSFLISGCSQSSVDSNHSGNEWSLPTNEVPLGQPGLKQTVRSELVSQGVTFYQIKRGEAGERDFWTVNIGFYTSAQSASTDVAALKSAGFTSRLDPSAGKNSRGEVLGYFLSVGKFSSKESADNEAKVIESKTRGKLKPKTRNTALAGDVTTGPWIINVLAIKPGQTSTKLVYALPGGDDLGGDGETVSAAANRLGAVAGINAGFFSNINPFKTPLPPRSPVGLTVSHGQVVGTAAGGRPAVMISGPEKHQQVEILPALTSEITLSDSLSNKVKVSSINRPILGTVINCGTPAEAPFSKPAHDYVCTNFNDLVVYDALYLHGKSSNTLINKDYKGESYELVVNATGVVLDGHEKPGAAAPTGGYVVQGLGNSAAWLKRHSKPGTKLTLQSHVYSQGKEIKLTPETSIVESGPSLSVANLLPNAWKEGFSTKLNGTDEGDSAGTANDSWYQGWVVGRNGRTAIGVTADKTVLLVEIPGRQPTVSLGTSIPETAAVMSWLGAKTAMNLDGGGSSNMVVKGQSVGYPSDASGERGVAGTLMLVPQKP
ncbi:MULTISPECIES: phosphodiester glycosidase family protein [Erwiniaceae]|uniref:phosphodiester glycosidase family protein n=1 Tax=Erwiniaceae TaxID=1903409 RepID=UPI00190AE1B8|nr:MULTISPECIES: phosphodiester glycosidase family protein [Erwiniaceae]MBK0093430.1 phosphodiester glycosidase family protein [Erwinia sp. S59]MBK0123692.1 phosphodiester glycosidase family protein [Pantoea sp. S61]